MLPGNRFTSKLKYTGDRNAASYQGDFRFACVQDRGCRGTVHFAERRAFRSLDTGAEGHGGVWSRWGGWVCFFYKGGVLFVCVLLCWFSFEAHNVELPRRRTRIARILRISADTRSARIRVICVIRVLSWAAHIYHYFNIISPAPNMPPNSYTVSCSDPALIEDTAFVCMFLAASLEKVREDMRVVDVFLFDHVCYFCCDGRGLACACEDQLGGLGCV